MSFFIRQKLFKVSATVTLSKRKLHKKLSYKHQIGDLPLIPITLGTLLEQTARKYGDRDAMVSVHQNKKVTYDEALQKCDRLAAALQDLGLKKGEKVGIWATNLIEWYISMFACARAGVVLVTINPAYLPLELEYCINKVGIKVLICQDKDKYKDFYESLINIAPDIKNSEPGKIKSRELPSLQSIILFGNSQHKGTYNYNELINNVGELSIKRIKDNQKCIDPDEGFNIQFTSGTTGKPKAAFVSHFTMVNNALQIAHRANILDKSGLRMCVQTPFFHAMGTVVALPVAMHCGAAAIAPSPTFKPNKVLDAIVKEKCTMITGTPTMYVDLVTVQEERQENINLDLAITGGAPCSPSLFEDMTKILNIKRIQSVYGMTELTAVSFQSKEGDSGDIVLNTVGHVGDHLEVKVVDDKGKMVPFGTSGELCVRGYSCMIGYYEDDEKTKELMGQDRWLKTGDLFILDENGYGKIVGRSKDVIIRGGENVYSKEIEDFLNTHPDILESSVIGIPDKRLGEEVMSCLRMKNGKNLDEKDIKQFCKGKLSHYKIPKYVKILEDFPKTASGKVQKFKLIERFSEGSVNYY